LSPLSLATRNAWFNDNGGHALKTQVDVILASRAALIGLSTLGEASGARVRGRHGMSWYPRQGFRPPVGDDPICWREYTLPFRAARQPLSLIQARHVLNFLRQLVVTALPFLAWAVAVGYPLTAI
jgi:hypothetical protein